SGKFDVVQCLLTFDATAAHQQTSQLVNTLGITLLAIGAQQQTSGVQVARTGILQILQQLDGFFGTILIQVQLGRSHGTSLFQTGIIASGSTSGGQGFVTLSNLTLVMRSTRCCQTCHDFAGLRAGFAHQLHQVFFSLLVTTFQNADPASFQQSLVTALSATTTPQAETLRTIAEPGQQAQQYVQHDEQPQRAQDHVSQRGTCQIMRRDQIDITGVFTQDQSQRDRSDK